MKRLWFGRTMVLALLACAAPSQAQVFTPTFQSPRLVNEIGVYLSDGPGDLTLEGLWRGGPMGLRVGLVDDNGGLLSIGGELRNPLPVAGAPLGLAFTVGAQALLGDQNAVGVQGGLSAGYTFRPSGAAVTPYIHPRIAFVDEPGPEEFRARVLADAGVDVEFWNNLLFRFGVSLADVGASWGIGLGIRR